MVNINKIDNSHWEIFINELPDWMIPMIKVTPLFYTTEGVSWDNLILNTDFNYLWEKVDNKNYKLYIYLAGYINNPDGDDPPLYVDLKLYIINNANRLSLQHNLGY